MICTYFIFVSFVYLRNKQFKYYFVSYVRPWLRITWFLLLLCWCCSMCACLNNCVALNLRVLLISIVSERERARAKEKNIEGNEKTILSLLYRIPRWPWDYVFIVSPPPAFLFSITKFNQPDIIKHWHNFF